MKLGKLKKVDLRDYWKHEALDFTRWLSEKENLDGLADEIGLDIQLIQTEASVGRFSVDILAQEEATGKKIVIENQLETTDHSHLGQILTYAAGIEAEYIVWIVKDARDEHKQAVDWLNEHTNEKLNFFLIRIELWQIGDSQPAPKFVIISSPNNWTKAIRDSVNNQSDLSEIKLFQFEFWQQLREYSIEQKASIKLRKPHPQHWYDVSIGRSDCHITLTTLASKNQIGCEIYIPNDKQLFDEFYANKQEIENELGIGELSWQKLPDKKASRIRVFYGFNFANQNRTEAFAWLVAMMSKFKITFSKTWLVLPQS